MMEPIALIIAVAAAAAIFYIGYCAGRIAGI